mgnify:FL=1
MSDERKDIWNDDDGEQEARRARRAEKNGKLKSFLTFFLALALVLAVVVLAAYRDGTGFDILRRYLNYGRPEQTGGTALYAYDASPKNRFAAVEENLAVLSETSLRLFDKGGQELWSVDVNMGAPALTAGGGRLAAYDVGGTSLYVANAGGMLLELTAAEGEPFLAASLNEDGWLAVTAEKKGCKGCVSVYDPEMKLAFAFDSRRRFVLDGCVVGKRLAAVTLGQENGVFVSNIVLYELTKEEPAADYDVSGGLVAAIGQQNGKIAAVSDTVLSYAKPDGEIEASYSYGGDYLRDFDLGGDGFTALLLNRYRSGSVGRLVTVDSDGAELGTLEVREEILSLSAAGRYLAVLYSGRLEVYNQDLQTYASLRGVEDVREVLMRPDGSVLMLSGSSASLFLP